MIGPGNGVAALISTPALDTDLTLSTGQLTSDAHNPDERCDDRKRRMFTAYGQPLDHAHFSAEDATHHR